MWSSKELLDAFLSTTTDNIIPLTAAGVASGCKVFGAAILRKEDLSPVIAATNHETESPLLHGEINCIQKFYAIPAQSRPSPKECIFFATHEPCSLWFDNHYFLFTYEETRDAFSIPHDIKILEEVFRVPVDCETPQQLEKRPLYNKTNAFWTAKSVTDLVNDLPEDEIGEMKRRVKEVKDQYNGLSEVYQKGKGGAGIPLA